MKVLIIEDEMPGVERLTDLLAAIDPAIEVVAAIDSVAGSLAWFGNNDVPDLVFMDIELSDGQCFALLKQINIPCGIIFTTSYNEYALDAFEYNSIAYLTKPIRKETLEKSLQKFAAFRELFRYDAGALKDLAPVAKNIPSRDRFLVKRGQKYISVPLGDIAYFYSEDRIVFLVTYSGIKHILDYTLEELETMLDGKQFYRVNRSFIIHVSSVSSFENDFNSRLRLFVNPAIDREILVSREKASEFKGWMGK